MAFEFKAGHNPKPKTESFLDVLESQAETLVELLHHRKENDKTWRQDVTTVAANISNIYNEWLR